MQNAFSYKLHTLLYAQFAFQRFKVSSIGAQAGKQQLRNPAAYTSFAQKNASCICNLLAEPLIDSTIWEHMQTSRMDDVDHTDNCFFILQV
jgi:hypothetical protein